MMPGFYFLLSALYLTLTVALVISLLDTGIKAGFLVRTLKRWAKFLLGLVILGLVVQIFTWLAG
jgi:hypothetical protein